MQVPFKKFLRSGRLVFPDGLLPLRLLLDAFLPLGVGGSEVEQFAVSVLHAHGRRAGNCIGLLSNTALPLSTYSKPLLIFQHHLIPCDS